MNCLWANLVVQGDEQKITESILYTPLNITYFVSLYAIRSNDFTQIIPPSIKLRVIGRGHTDRSCRAVDRSAQDSRGEIVSRSQGIGPPAAHSSHIEFSCTHVICQLCEIICKNKKCSFPTIPEQFSTPRRCAPPQREKRLIPTKPLYPVPCTLYHVPSTSRSTCEAGKAALPVRLALAVPWAIEGDQADTQLLEDCLIHEGGL